MMTETTARIEVKAVKLMVPTPPEWATKLGLAILWPHITTSAMAQGSEERPT